MVCSCFILTVFLSTPSGWRATCNAPQKVVIYSISIHALRVEGDATSCMRSPTPSTNFYPRPPGGGRHLDRPQPLRDLLISIHALRVEGDLDHAAADDHGVGFLSTPSGWRATRGMPVGMVPVNFYPRPPGGGRQQKRTKFSSVFAQKGEEIASLRRGKRKFAGGVLKRTNFGF